MQIEILFLKKKTKSTIKELNCKFIKINTSRKNYDADYEASRIQIFISRFKENEVKKIKR